MILTIEQMQQRISELTYRPDWKMRVYEGNTEGAHFELIAPVPDSVNKGKMSWLEIYSPIPPQVSIQSFDLWVFDRLKRIEIHECGEWLQCNDKPLFDPHRNMADRDLIEIL